MIKLFTELKMLRKLVILPLLFIAIHASGEFSILNSPASLEFKGNDKLSTDNVGDVFSASLGHWVDSNSNWGGLIVKDPFNVAEFAVAVLVEGVEDLSLNQKSKDYPLVGNSAQESLTTLSADLESNFQVVDLDFRQAGDALIDYSEIFGEFTATSVKATNSLKPELHSEDKHFLKQIAYINTLAEKLSTLEKHPNFLACRVSLTPIANAHGEKSIAMVDAKKLLAASIDNLLKSSKKVNDEVLFVVIASKFDQSRSKRQAVAPKANDDDLNLADYYNEDYPVIFNIILWFMVVLAFSLLAICYAIAAMDPGRDSIIYRMTSTRMKKDN